MLDNKSRPMIEKISKLLVSNHFSALLDVVASPKSPLELKMHSPRAPKNYDLDLGGVGLGIVAALYKSGDVPGSEMVAKYFVSSPRQIPNCYVKKLYGPEKDFFRKTRSEHGRSASIFCVSPPKSFQDYTRMDFLSACELCNKKLHGKDIYMYRGEKWFCSNECRERHIIVNDADDQRKECRSKARKLIDVPSSPYAEGNIFSACILAI